MDLEGKWKAILIGGLITGFGPFVPILQIACCIYPILGAFVAVAIYRGDRPIGLTNNDGMVLGAMSGLVGTALYAVLVVPVTLLIGTFLGGFLSSLSPHLEGVPAHVRPMLEWLFGHMGAAFGIVVVMKVLFQLALSVIFGLLGGLLGVALFRPQPQ